MSAPAWLPPLNSHDNYVISTRIDGAKEILRYPENRGGPKPLFRIHVKVKVIFYKENDNIGFSGLLLDKVFSVPSPAVDEFILICDFLGEVAQNLLATRLNIPFQLYPIYFLESDDEYSLQDEHGLMHKLQSVLHAMMCKCKSDSDMAAIRWEILKNVTIPADEYDAWTSWYAEKSRADPNFKWEYMRAIRRPRTTDELLYEELVKSRAATESSIQGLEKVENLNSTSNCSVCLEDVSPGSAAIRLPCSHVFHRDCIVKWLKESHMCPLCRFTLPTSEK